MADCNDKIREVLILLRRIQSGAISASMSSIENYDVEIVEEALKIFEEGKNNVKVTI
jgi:hypothetical protein